MAVVLKIMILLLHHHYAGADNLFGDPEKVSKSNLEEFFKKSRIPCKRSPKPLEMGFVSFELNQHHGRNLDIPAIVRQSIVVKNIPILSRSGSITAISTEKGPKAANYHLPISLHGQRVVLPIVQKIHLIHDPNIEHLLVDRSANVKHVILEENPLVLDHVGQTTVVFGHKPLVITHQQQKSIVVHHHHPKTVIAQDGTKSMLLSATSQIHEIIVQRHDPGKIMLAHSEEEKNLFRSHFGGYGAGIDYGGHGAGHGFYVPLE